MKVIIDISKDMYEECQGHIYFPDTDGELFDAVKNSTPLLKGHWIIDDEEDGIIWRCHCSNCKKDPKDYICGSENWWVVRLPDFCPNCGADMRGE